MTPPEQKAINQQARDRAGHRCEHCGPESDRYEADGNHPERTNSAGEPLKLQVHHIDHIRSNNESRNLVTLCQGCHLEIHRHNWKPGDRLPSAWATLWSSVPTWITARKLPYKLAAQIRMGLEDNQARGGLSEIVNGALIQMLDEMIYSHTSMIDRAIGKRERVILETIYQPQIWQLQRQRDYLQKLEDRGIVDLTEDLLASKHEAQWSNIARKWLETFEADTDAAFWEAVTANKSIGRTFTPPQTVIEQGTGVKEAEESPFF